MYHPFKRFVQHSLGLLLPLIVAFSPANPAAAQSIADAAPQQLQYEFVAVWGDSSPAGVISQPRQIVADASGNVYIADNGVHRIQVFTAAGGFIRSIGRAGKGSGEFYDPSGVAVRNNKVYVADVTNSRVQLFDASGLFIQQIGGWTSTQDPMQAPTRTGIDGSGRVYVGSDLLSGWVSRYSVAGTLERTFETLSCQTYFLVVASSGTFFCPHSYESGIVRVSSDDTRTIIGGVAGQPGYVANPTHLAITADDHLWAYDADVARVYHYAPNGDFINGFAVASAVEGLAAGGNRLFVLTAERQVNVYQADGALITTWGATASLRLDHPDGLAVAPDGTLYVLEKSRRRVHHLDDRGEPLAKMGAGIAPQGNLADPLDLAVDGWGRLYVLDDTFDSRIVRYDGDVFDTLFYGVNYASGLNPVSLVAAGDWLVWSLRNGMRTQADLDGYYNADSSDFSTTYQVVDMTVSAASLFSLQASPPYVTVSTLTGAPSASWGPGGSQPGQLALPTGIGVDLRGRVFITDSKLGPTPFAPAIHRHSVEVFDEAGAFLTQWGELGQGWGQFVDPGAVAALPNGFIVVADTGNNRLQVFAPIGPQPNPTPLPAPTPYTGSASPLPTDWQDFGPAGVTSPTCLTASQPASSNAPLVAVYGDRRQVAVSTDGVVWSRIARRDIEHWQVPVCPDVSINGQTLVSANTSYDAAYRSDDLGRTWLRLGDAPAYGPQEVDASPTYQTDRTLFNAAYQSGLWRSQDSGVTWELRSLAGQPIDNLAVAAAGSTRILFVSGPTSPSTNGLLRSTDDGATWSNTGQSSGQIGVSPFFAQDQTLFLAETDSSNPGVLRSRDGGVTWQRVGSATLPPYASWHVLFSPNYANDRKVLLWYGASAFLSTDAGDTWRRITPETLTNLQSMAFSPAYAQDSKILLGVLGQTPFLMTQNQGASWNPVTPGMPGAHVHDLDLSLIADGADWLLTADGLLARNGSQWMWVKRPPYPWVYPGAMARSPNFVQDRTALVRDAFTSDGGVTWQALPASSSYVYSASAFAPDWVTSRTALAILSDRTVTGGAAAVRTTNGGANWQSSTTNRLWQVTDVAFDPDWPSVARVYAASAGGMAYSSDLGQSWQAVGEPVGSAKTVQLATRQEGGQGVIYAATTSKGVWRSADHGAAWGAVNTGLPNGHVCALTADAEVLVAGLCDGRLYAQAAPQAVWRELLIQPGGTVTSLALRQSSGQRLLWVGTGSGVYRTPLTFTPALTLRLTWLPLSLRNGR